MYTYSLHAIEHTVGDQPTASRVLCSKLPTPTSLPNLCNTPHTHSLITADHRPIHHNLRLSQKPLTLWLLLRQIIHKPVHRSNPTRVKSKVSYRQAVYSMPTHDKTRSGATRRTQVHAGVMCTHSLRSTANQGANFVLGHTTGNTLV